jgi:ribonuclease Z
MFAVTILGNNSAIPAYNRHPTSQVVTLNEYHYLVDCGEGTQIQMTKYKIRRSKINHIFISHLHGDHYFGLIGLIMSLGLWGREQDLHLYAPAPLEAIIDLQLKAADAQLSFKLIFHPIQKEDILVDDKKITISCFAVKHRVECWGFIFREKRNPRKLDGEKVRAHEVPSSFYERLQQGEDYIQKDGTVIKNDVLTNAAPKARMYAYCADTIFDETIAEKVKHADLLYHETTYLHELADRAAKRFHSTTIQAATIARLAGAEKLIIGHFSSKYEQLDAFQEEAASIFEPVELAVEGTTYKI